MIRVYTFLVFEIDILKYDVLVATELCTRLDGDKY